MKYIDHTANYGNAEVMDNIESFRSEYSAFINGIIFNLDEQYHSTHFKISGSVIDIFYPTKENVNSKNFLKNADYIRYVMSIYPRKEDFANIKRIIIRPRFFESGDVHVAAIYIPNTKTLVYYLHFPYLYSVLKTDLGESSESLFNISKMNDPHNLGKGKPENSYSIKLTPLLYYIFMVAKSNKTNIEKFFMRSSSNDEKEILKKLRAISKFYAESGY